MTSSSGKEGVPSRTTTSGGASRGGGATLGSGGGSMERINVLLKMVQDTTSRIADSKRIEKARSRSAWIKIKDAVREADSKYLEYLREWDNTKRQVDHTYESYKQDRLKRKRLDAEIKLAKAKIKTLRKTKA